MNTTGKVVIVLVLIGIAGGAWFFLQNTDSESLSYKPSTESKTGITVSEDNAGFGSIKSIMGKGENVACEIGLSSEEAFASEGMVYIDGENGQFRMNIENPDGSKIGIISTAETMYQWFGSEGTKVSQAKAEEMAAFNASDPYLYDEDTDMAESYDDELEYRYECESWRVDPSLFVPPTNVAFTDMDEMIDMMKMDMPEAF